MKTRIESAELKRLGATSEQLHAYDVTDPLVIYRHDDGCLYTITGAMEADGITVEEVMEYLQAINDYDAEEVE